MVVDASLVVKWLIDEEHSEEAKNLRRRWSDDGVVLTAPHLMPYEVSNALRRRVAEGTITLEGAADLMTLTASHRVALYEAHDFHSQALQLASRFSQRAIYDSHYLALALALDCEFWTADERFYRSVTNDLWNVRLISEATAPNQ